MVDLFEVYSQYLQRRYVLSRCCWYSWTSSSYRSGWDGTKFLNWWTLSSCEMEIFTIVHLKPYLSQPLWNRLILTQILIIWKEVNMFEIVSKIRLIGRCRYQSLKLFKSVVFLKSFFNRQRIQHKIKVWLNTNNNFQVRGIRPKYDRFCYLI